MNMLYRRSTKQLVNKILSACILIALLLGYQPHSVAQAAPPAAPNTTCQIPTVNLGNNIFLPMLTNLGSSVVAMARSNPSEPQSTPREIQYEVGKTYVYDWNLTVDSQTVAYDAEGMHDNGTNKTIVHASAHVAITSKNPAGDYVGDVSLHDPFICSTDGSEETIMDDADIISALQTPIRFEQKPNGVITSVSVPLNADPQVTNLQKGVIDALQLTLQDGASSYEAEENGSSGTYSAAYSLEEKGLDLHVTKSYDQSDFSTLLQSGDEIKSLTIDVATNAIIGAERGVPTSIESTAKIATASDDESANSPDGSFVGTSIWSKINSNSKLALSEVKDTTQTRAAAVNTDTYVDNGLGTTLPEPEQNQQAIDLAQVDLDAEFTALEADVNSENEGTNPAYFVRILDLANADTGTVVVEKIWDRLQANADNDEIARIYVDLLAAVGTPYAQNILNGVLGNQSVRSAGLAAQLSTEIQEQALVNLVLLSSPISTTVATVKSLSAPNSESTLKDIAVSVLGATIKNLADEDAGMAQSLTDELVQSLSATSLVTEVQVYLDALGNSGMPSVFPTIQSYISGTEQSARMKSDIVSDADVRTAALFALRSMPDQEAEDLLVATVQNSEENEAFRMQAANALAERPSLSDTASTALQSYQTASLAQPGLYRRNWNSTLGSAKLGVEFPGGMTVASPPRFSMYAYAYQRANALVLYRNLNVVKGSVTAREFNDRVYLNAYLTLGGNRIRKSWQGNYPCSTSRSGTIWQGYVTIVEGSGSTSVYGVPVTFNYKISGSAKLSYSMSANVCNPNNSSISVTITPEAWATARGEGGVGVSWASGGGGISAEILRTKLPLTVSTAYNGSNFRFCGDVKVSTMPLSGRIYAYVKVGWWRKTKTITNFSTSSYTYTLWRSCG